LQIGQRRSSGGSSSSADFASRIDGADGTPPFLSLFSINNSLKKKFISKKIIKSNKII